MNLIIAAHENVWSNMDHSLDISRERERCIPMKCCSCVAWLSKILYFSVSKSTFNLIPGGFTKVLEHLKCASVMPSDIAVCILPFIHFLLGSLREGRVSALQPGEALNEWPLRQSQAPRLEQMLNGERRPLGPDAGGCLSCLWITLIPWNNGAPPCLLWRGN